MIIYFLLAERFADLHRAGFSISDLSTITNFILLNVLVIYNFPAWGRIAVKLRFQFDFLIPISSKTLIQLLRHIIMRLTEKQKVQDTLIELISPSPMYLMQSNKIFSCRKV